MGIDGAAMMVADAAQRMVDMASIAVEPTLAMAGGPAALGSAPAMPTLAGATASAVDGGRGGGGGAVIENLVLHMKAIPDLRKRDGGARQFVEEVRAYLRDIDREQE
jgi:hypothetical protein